MDEQELMDALDGLSAWDAGCVSSGIHDDELKERCKEYLRSLSATDRRLILGRIGRNLYLTDQRLEQGYGLEDIAGFTRWLDDEGILL